MREIVSPWDAHGALFDPRTFTNCDDVTDLSDKNTIISSAFVPTPALHTYDLMARNPWEDRHDLVLDNGVRVTDTTGKNLANDFARSRLLHLDIDKLERLADFLLEGGLVGLGQVCDGRHYFDVQSSYEECLPGRR